MIRTPIAHRSIIAVIAALSVSSAAAAPEFYDAVPINEPGSPNCSWTNRFASPIVYQESDFIRAYFEPADLAAYRRAIEAPFEMPPRPLVRVSVLDFYGMANGPVYLESEISVLALHEGQPGWFLLTMPVTDGDACAAGRFALGTPKVMRRITLVRSAERYVGTTYARASRTPDFILSMDVGEPGDAAREVLRFVSSFPDLMLLKGRVVKFGGRPQPIYELESLAPEVWKVSLGEARLEYPREPGSLLHRLGVGRPLAAFWGRMRARYSITPR